MKAILMFSFILFFGMNEISAQQEYRRYGTQEYMQYIEKEYPDLTKNRKKIEQHSRHYSKFGDMQDFSIPIVFHVVQSQKSPSLSERSIHLQLESLNEDFELSNPNENHISDHNGRYRKLAANTQISFCFAELSNKGIDAINYVHSEVDFFEDFDAVKSTKTGGVDAYNPQSYLNIWICNLKDNLAGYAQMPGGPQNTDGIVIDFDYFGLGKTNGGQNYNGKTLTHLIGNYLNLYDLWGDNCRDDYVWDTPIHNAPNLNCPLYRHVSTCDMSTLEMPMNFMDATPDECVYMFTHGQKHRMQACLAEGGPRSGLIHDGLDCNRAPEEDETTALEDNSLQDLDVRFIPNPANEYFNILFASQVSQADIKLYDSNGKRVYTHSISNQDAHRINTTHLNPGIYFIDIRLDNNQVQSGKIFIE